MKNILFAVFLLSIVGCGDGPGKRSSAGPLTFDDSGHRMVIQYCGSCHLPVQPGVLDRKTWKDHVLPAMAEKMGIRVWNGNQYYPATGNAQPLISFTDWMKLVEYFDHTAPDSLQLAKSVSLKQDWFGFALKKPLVKGGIKASTMMVSFDTISNKIFTADNENYLHQWNAGLRQEQKYLLPSPAVNVDFRRNEGGGSTGIFTLIGTMQAVDQSLGEIVSFTPHDPAPKPLVMAAAFPRPVESVAGDFNRDGLEDWLVCGFGHEAGALYLAQQNADHTFSKKVIRDVPGATQCITGDFNGDGWPDFYCLFAHGDEGIWLFTNDRKGGFKSENILRFPPYYGSTSFQLVDFNKDGRLDILYTCGDNSDYSRILKPFHGVYIFRNEGGNKYSQAWFYHVNGSTKAVAADFTGDGKIDIATIAFFADLQHNPLEKFICFEQQGEMRFLPHALPLSRAGRWICMDVKDYDHDGDQDIILGNFSRGFINQPGFEPDWDVYTPFVVLENRRGK
ncbi:MAG: VCBS repeat-containing protein [Chitinophagaceae bacterium]